MSAPLTVRARSLVSRPYIDMTLALMRHFGALTEEHGDGAITVHPGGYTAADLTIEPDASTASYFFAAAAVTGRSVTVPGLGTGSSQGDLGFVEVLRRTGAEVEITASATTVTGRPDGRLTGGFDVDMGNISDTFMTLAAIAPLADGPVTVTGIGHARLKESDRIGAVARNLRALGIHTEEGPERITVHPGAPGPPRSPATATTGSRWPSPSSACAPAASPSTTRPAWPRPSPASTTNCAGSSPAPRHHKGSEPRWRT